MPAEILRSQLSSLSEGIYATNLMIQRDEILKQQANELETLVTQYQRQERKEHASLLNRKLIIEARKEKIENIRNAKVNMA